MRIPIAVIVSLIGGALLQDWKIILGIGLLNASMVLWLDFFEDLRRRKKGTKNESC